MKKINILYLLIYCLTFLLSPQESFAYGGGGGFPTFPSPQVKLICINQTRTYKLPFGRTYTFQIPKCHLEIIKTDREEFKSRWEEFINRIKNGNS